MKAAIFDLDGVIVDTAEFHYLAWKEIADAVGIGFTKTDNERLKGVGRMCCLDIILGLGEVSPFIFRKRKIGRKEERTIPALCSRHGSFGNSRGSRSPNPIPKCSYAQLIFSLSNTGNMSYSKTLSRASKLRDLQVCARTVGIEIRELLPAADVVFPNLKEADFRIFEA